MSEINLEEMENSFQEDCTYDKNEESENLCSAKYNLPYHILKRTIDIVGSFCGIIVLSPILLLISILVIIDDHGCPFYSHERIGINGKKIKVYKFRSMKIHNDSLEDLLTPEQLEIYKTEFKIENDPRITRVGKILRKTSLDELPQMLNILLGDLSIIGPRPIVEDELSENYNEEDKVKFLSVKPGLTGYWQAYARNDASYATGIRQKMELYYVDHKSIWFDVKIFFKTIATVVTQKGSM